MPLQFNTTDQTMKRVIQKKLTGLSFLDPQDSTGFGASDAYVNFIKNQLCFEVFSNKEKLEECIQYIAPSFQKKYSSSCKEFRGGIRDQVFGNLCGTIIMPAENGYHTSFYSLEGSILDGKFIAEGFIYTFQISASDNPVPVLMFAYQNDAERQQPMFYLAQLYEKAGLNSKDYFDDSLTFLLYRQYCQIESTILEHGSKAIIDDCEYNNEIGHNVEVLN